MNTKLIAALFTVAYLAVPSVSFAVDSDANRTEVKTYAKDAVITTKIKTKLATKENIKSLSKISVDTVNNGDVTLTGSAESQQEVDKAVKIAKRTEGVKNVNSEIEVKKDD